MKTLKLILPLLLVLLMAGGCKKEESHQMTDYRLFQDANVRMEIKDAKKNSSKSVGIVGDSVSVKRLARWGETMHTTIMRGPNAGFTGGSGISLDYKNNGMFSRDTVNNIYIFSSLAVFDYWAQEQGEDGRWYGVTGTEKPGWLLIHGYPVFVGYYDTIKQRYKDPLIDDDLGWWLWRVDTLGYIPQKQIDENYPRLQQLYDERRIDEMIEIMKTGYTIYTCTGEEYRELVRLGLN